MTLGNRTLIHLILNNFNGDLNTLTLKKLSVMHCAAQSYQGYISILILRNEFNFNMNGRDAYRATPLHFAILKGEFMNV